MGEGTGYTRGIGMNGGRDRLYEGDGDDVVVHTLGWERGRYGNGGEDRESCVRGMGLGTCVVV